MNREIKFRAWDSTLHKMMVPLTLPEIAEQCNVNWYQLTFLQFTGLKDKNGKEIYEGDIIHSPDWWWGPCAVEYRSGEVGPCEADNVMEWGLSKCHNLWDGCEVTVLGNIYENPALLSA